MMTNHLRAAREALNHAKNRIVYWPGMPKFIKRLHRDDTYLGVLKGEVDRFNDELDALVERIRKYGERAAA